MPDIKIFTVAEAPPELPRHGSATVVELRDGRLLLAWMESLGGATIGHDHAPTQIATMISRDGGYSWTDRKIVLENHPGDINIHYPCYLRIQSGDILFFHQRLHQLEPGEPQRSSSFVCRSSDDGETFSPDESIDILRNTGVAANEPLQLRTGRIILPIQDVQGDWCGDSDHQLNGTCYSDDEGRTWTMCTNWVDLPLRGAMEPHIVERKDGSLLMYMRTQLGAVFQSESEDGGASWSLPQTTGLRAPESMPCLVKIPSTGDFLVIWNHSDFMPEFDHCGRRTPLTTAISRDDGKTWESFKDIETDPGYEFTNPSCFFTREGKVIIFYEASKMENPEPPGELGRSCMPMKEAIADVEWFYE